jgi:hypothetical protein
MLPLLLLEFRDVCSEAVAEHLLACSTQGADDHRLHFQDGRLSADQGPHGKLPLFPGQRPALPGRLWSAGRLATLIYSICWQAPPDSVIVLALSVLQINRQAGATASEPRHTSQVWRLEGRPSHPQLLTYTCTDPTGGSQHHPTA